MTRQKKQSHPPPLPQAPQSTIPDTEPNYLVSRQITDHQSQLKKQTYRIRMHAPQAIIA